MPGLPWCRAGRRGRTIRRARPRRMPGPSSSISISTQPSAAARPSRTRGRRHIWRHSRSRLPSISSRSWRSTRTCGVLVAGDVDGDVLVEPVDRALDRLERCPRPSARAWAEARRPIARARARWWSTWRRIAVASRQTVSARSGAWAVAALVMTVSGVLSAWARLPAWRRASSACASLCASSSLISSTSGSISRGKSSAMRVWLPRADRGDLAAHAAQRPQAVEGLQRGEDEQAERRARRSCGPGSSAARGSARRSRRATARPGSASGRRDPGRITSRSRMRSGSPANSTLS